MRVTLHRVPTEHIARSFQRKEIRLKSGDDSIQHRIGSPALGRMGKSDWPALVKQENFVVAHTEYLTTHTLSAITDQGDSQRSDLVRSHLLNLGDPGFFFFGISWDSANQATPGERRDTVRAYSKTTHVQRHGFRQAYNAQFSRCIIGLPEITD